MSAMYGADADELDRLAAEFNRAADELDREGGALTGILNNISWIGDSAGRFVSDWTGVDLPKIGLSTRFLRETATELAHNAAQQRQASTSTGAGSGALGSARLLSDRPAAGSPGNAWVAFDPHRISEGAGTLFAGIDTAFLALGFLPTIGRLPSWLIGADDWLALRALGTGALRKLPGLSHLGQRYGGLKAQLGRVRLTDVSNFGTGLAAVLGGIDVYLNQDKYGFGDAETIAAEVDAVLGTAASRVPGGAIVYGATRFVTDAAYDVVDDAFGGRISDNGYRDYVERAYHVTDLSELTSSQIEEINQRYYGWSGLYHATGDSIIAAGRDALGAAGRGVRSVGSFLNPFD